MISSSEIPVKDKLTSLEQDYHIAATREVKEGISSMCNWSEGVIERNNLGHIVRLMKNSNISFKEACRLLELNPKDYADLIEEAEDIDE